MARFRLRLATLAVLGGVLALYLAVHLRGTDDQDWEPVTVQTRDKVPVSGERSVQAEPAQPLGAVDPKGPFLVSQSDLAAEAVSQPQQHGSAAAAAVSQPDLHGPAAAAAHPGGAQTIAAAGATPAGSITADAKAVTTGEMQPVADSSRPAAAEQQSQGSELGAAEREEVVYGEPDDDAPLPPGHKYMMHELTNGGVDNCVGWNHVQGSLSCAMAEAKALGRVFVMPYLYCVPEEHQVDRQGSHFPFTQMADFGVLERDFPFIFKSNMTRVLDTAMAQGLTISDPVTLEDRPRTLMGRQEDILVRAQGPDWWLRPCEDDYNDPEGLQIEPLRWTIFFHPPTRLVLTARSIAESMGDFDSLHVRRGDKLTESDQYGLKFPNLDEETRPHSILASIAPFSPPGRRLYIASNEQDPGFFAPLTDHYQVYLWRNFTDVLVEAALVQLLPCAGQAGSSNAALARRLMAIGGGGTCVSVHIVNNMLLYQVEQLVQQQARLSMDTFNYLTSTHIDGHAWPNVSRPTLAAGGPHTKARFL